ncbi:U3 small nucleolar RNA-associated 17 [Lecanosticta acicola]|uniref:U3 small nucleolar RNA-associated 17 n=1 Tax=Lecanosticta acicola TaxID=111012 RepID=A0AAI8YSP2_9PEZI|nr:U3 small nucleolar RNA-associated 17 [Lecanosticta acicola]
MTRENDRKRKLEQDQAGQIATPKRLKPSTGGDSARKDEASSSTPSGKPQKQGVKNAPSEGAAGVVTPTSGGKSKKGKKRHSNHSGTHAETEETPTSKLAQPNAKDNNDAEAALGTAKRSKRSRRKSRETGELALVKFGDEPTREGASHSAEQSITSLAKQQRREEKRAKRRAGKEVKLGVREDETLTTPNKHGWYLSAPSAGRYLDHDPIYVQDEHGDECLIAATAREIQLLSLETSLVIRSHVVPNGRSIACYCLSNSDSQSVEFAYDNGAKVRWNWVTSEMVKGTFPGQEVVIAMTTATLANGNHELFYITEKDDIFSVVGERKVLRSSERRLTSIQVMHQGAYIVCLSATAIVLGARNSTEPHSDYTWVEIPVGMPIHCLDAKIILSEQNKKQRPEMAIAVGNAEGQIHLYNSVTSVFRKSQPELARPRILHWHREPVSAVKFSRDGNYLISGGKETVLVIWQLETGKYAFLPHLTAEIERIVVSPEGAQYALQMGDNSIMVLSTSELKAVANCAGLQLPQLTDEMTAQGIELPRTTALLHPKDPYRLLLSVPSTQPKTIKDITTRPFLQAFDIRHSRHLLRQALTRNNVTDFNLGPERTPIVPPDVSQLAVSADGQWLATVDEWWPPAADLEHHISRRNALDEHDVMEVSEEQERKREVYLKFWRWNEAQQMWTLSTRVDAPHALSAHAHSGSGAGRVLKLVADPSENCFATMGEDSVVKIWQSKARTRQGVVHQEADGTDAVDWTCKRSIALPVSARMPERADSPLEDIDERPTPPPLVDASLAFSPDGSMLACGQVTLDDDALPLIHFISPQTGAITASKAGLVSPEQDLIDIAFLDRFFVSLSVGSVRVWNLVDDSHVYTIALNDKIEEQEDAMLAVNHTDDTFAFVSYVNPESAEPARPKVEVYHPKQPVCLFAAEFTTMPAALLAGNGTRGFTVLFEDGTIRAVSSTTNAAHRSELSLPKKEELLALPSAETTSALAGMHEQEHVEEVEPLALAAGEYIRDAAVVEDDRQVVRPEQLALVSDVGLNSSMPALTEMFQNIVGLYARKPRQNAVAEAERDLMEM